VYNYRIHFIRLITFYYMYVVQKIMRVRYKIIVMYIFNLQCVSFLLQDFEGHLKAGK